MTFRMNTPRAQGGLGNIKIPLMSDLTHTISKDYGVLLEDAGHTLRYVSLSPIHSMHHGSEGRIMLVFDMTARTVPLIEPLL